MIAVIQRVSRAEVSISGETIASIGHGILALVAVENNDTSRDLNRLTDKLLNYRIFEDLDGRMNRSVASIEGGILLVPQFTLAADTRKGLRPGFSRAAPAEKSSAMFDDLVKLVKTRHSPVECGSFGANMQVSLINDGPVTFVLEVRGTR